MAVTNVSRPGHMEIRKTPIRPFNYPEKVSVPEPIMNIQEITQQLQGIIKQDLLEKLPDYAEDLQIIVQEIAPVLASAVVSGDAKLKGELMAQIGLIAEIGKIRGNAQVKKVIMDVAGFALSLVSVGLSAAVKAATGGIV